MEWWVSGGARLLLLFAGFWRVKRKGWENLRLATVRGGKSGCITFCVYWFWKFWRVKRKGWEHLRLAQVRFGRDVHFICLSFRCMHTRRNCSFSFIHFVIFFMRNEKMQPGARDGFLPPAHPTNNVLNSIPSCAQQAHAILAFNHDSYFLLPGPRPHQTSTPAIVFFPLQMHRRRGPSWHSTTTATVTQRPWQPSSPPLAFRSRGWPPSPSLGSSLWRCRCT